MKEAAVMGSKVGAGAAMEGAKRARQASRIKPWDKGVVEKETLARKSKIEINKKMKSASIDTKIKRLG